MDVQFVTDLRTAAPPSVTYKSPMAKLTSWNVIHTLFWLSKVTLLLSEYLRYYMWSNVIRIVFT